MLEVKCELLASSCYWCLFTLCQTAAVTVAATFVSLQRFQFVELYTQFVASINKGKQIIPAYYANNTTTFNNWQLINILLG